MGEVKSRHYYSLLQRLSVAVQRGNAVAVLGSIIGGSVTLREDEVPYNRLFLRARKICVLLQNAQFNFLRV